MKKSVRITTIVICSIIVAFAASGFVLAYLGAEQYEQLKNLYSSNEAWRATVEYEFYSAHLMQMVASFAVILHSSSMLICVICWKRMNDAANNPNFYLDVIMNKRTIKFHIPLEITGISLGVALCLVFQFVNFSAISESIIVLFAILLFLLNIMGIALLMTTICTLIYQKKDEQFDPDSSQRVK